MYYVPKRRDAGAALLRSNPEVLARSSGVSETKVSRFLETHDTGRVTLDRPWKAQRFAWLVFR